MIRPDHPRRLAWSAGAVALLLAGCSGGGVGAASGADRATAVGCSPEAIEPARAAMVEELRAGGLSDATVTVSEGSIADLDPDFTGLTEVFPAGCVLIVHVDAALAFGTDIRVITAADIDVAAVEDFVTGLMTAPVTTADVASGGTEEWARPRGQATLSVSLAAAATGGQTPARLLPGATYELVVSTRTTL